jgi:hypothetical protein
MTTTMMMMMMMMLMMTIIMGEIPLHLKKAYREVAHSCTYSYPRRVSLVPWSLYRTRWAPNNIWTHWRTEIYMPLPGYKVRIVQFVA